MYLLTAEKVECTFARKLYDLPAEFAWEVCNLAEEELATDVIVATTGYYEEYKYRHSTIR